MNAPTPNQPQQAVKVYISYTHDSGEHKTRVLDLANRLRGDGIDCALDQYEPSPSEGWPRWMEKHIQKSDFVLIVCTETYYRRFEGQEKPGRGKGVRFEGAIITQQIYEQTSRKPRFIPVLFNSVDQQYIPRPLRVFTYYDIGSQDGYDQLLQLLIGDQDIKRPPLGQSRAGQGKTTEGSKTNDPLEPTNQEETVSEGEDEGADEKESVGASFDDLRETDFTEGAWAVLQVARRLGDSRPRPLVCSVRRVVASLMLWGLADKQAQHTGWWLAKQISYDEESIRKRLGKLYPMITSFRASFPALLEADKTVAQAMTPRLKWTIDMARRLAAESSEGVTGARIAARHLLGGCGVPYGAPDKCRAIPAKLWAAPG